jgi:polysaccharide deacetylase 2 family uncharacterized protein YibQ
MAGGRKLSVPRPQGVVLWGSVAALLSLGLLTTLIDLSGLPGREVARATAAQQRFVVNPATGEVLLSAPATKAPDPAETSHAAEPAEPDVTAAAKESFDVATAEEAHAPAPQAATEITPAETPAAAEPPPAEPAATTSDAAAPVPAVEAISINPVVDAPLPDGLPTLRQTPITADLNAPVATKDSLVSAPAPEVTETIDGMKLPKRGEKGATPSKLYAFPFQRKNEQVLLSFVVMDAGIDQQSLGLLLGLPKEVTVAYSPYARGNIRYSENLRALGHELWAMLPAMTDRYPSDDPGPMGIVNRMPAEEIIRRLREVMGTVQGSVGIVLPPNETLSGQQNALLPIINEINDRGLFMLSTNPSRSIDRLTTKTELMPILRRADLVLDPEPNEAQIRSRLAGIVAATTEKGEYLVVLSARPQTLQLLGDWLRDNPMVEPMMLAPLSALYQPREVPKAAEPAKAEGGHGGEEKKKEKPKPKPKKEKPLPQDKYKQPAAGKKEAGGH